VIIMAVNGEIELTWGDGEHKFNIAKLRCVLELEEKCNSGVAEILNRINEGRWRFNDIRETIRLGLVGGGMLPDKALTMTQRYVDDRPWRENVLPAQAIIYAALVGVAGDELEKKVETERDQADQSSARTVDSPVPSSTDSEPPSASTRAN
jgi:Phage tail tube protein, GTA-gp10